MEVLFQQYCAKYGKSYTTPEEYAMRKEAFVESHK
jgi:hypothetical protein